MDFHKEPSHACDVLLVFPRKRLTYSTAMLPLGLISIAAVLEEASYQVEVLDLNVFKGNPIACFKKLNPSIIGFGGTTPTRKSVFKMARLTKRVLPEVTIVYGGPHAAFTARDTLTNVSEIDFTISGEGEFPMLDLCSLIISGAEMPLSAIPGLGYRSKQGIVQNPPRRIEDLSVLPLPAKHLLKHHYPQKLDFEGVPAAFIMTSRGCPVQCIFCSASTMYKGGVRFHPMDKIRLEIEQIVQDQSIKGLKIFDSTFTSAESHVREFCEMIKPFNLLWECEVRADSVDYSLLSLMKDAGCCYIDLGLESSNPEFLNQLNKKIELDQVLNVINWCNDLDIKVKLFLIFGHPNQTFSDCLKEIKFLKTLREKVAFFDVSIGMRIFPGTQVEVLARKAGLINDNFSWVRFKPSWRRMLIGDMSDVFTWEQKRLNFYHLTLLAILLHVKGLSVPPSQYFRIMKQYAQGFIDKINILHRI